MLFLFVSKFGGDKLGSMFAWVLLPALSHLFKRRTYVPPKRLPVLQSLR